MCIIFKNLPPFLTFRLYISVSLMILRLYGILHASTSLSLFFVMHMTDLTRNSFCMMTMKVMMMIMDNDDYENGMIHNCAMLERKDKLFLSLLLGLLPYGMWLFAIFNPWKYSLLILMCSSLFLSFPIYLAISHTIFQRERTQKTTHTHSQTPTHHRNQNESTYLPELVNAEAVKFGTDITTEKLVCV